MEKILSVRIIVTSADELRDSLSTSGVFDMTDCKVYIDCPLDSKTSEVKKMVSVLESVINVVDVEVSGHVKAIDDEYIIDIVEVPIEVIEGKRPRKYNR
jgi:hypothetical protein